MSLAVSSLTSKPTPQTSQQIAPTPTASHHIIETSTTHQQIVAGRCAAYSSTAQQGVKGIKPCGFSPSESQAGNCPSHTSEGNMSNSNQSSQSKQAVRVVPKSRVVPKPAPQGSQNVRDYQLNQIRRRFSPKESQGQGGSTILQFSLKPSDPDFPYELSSLECALSIPANYPKSRPSLKVKNSEIQLGFAINIENGFDGLVAERQDASLLDLVKALDRNLEVFLSMEQAKTVKLVGNADKRHLKITSVEVAGTTKTTPVIPKTQNEAILPPEPTVYTNDEKNAAKAKRNLQVKQLESRLGRHSTFRKSNDGIAFTLPLEPRMRGRLPSPLKATNTVTLYVPLLYPLEPCRVKLEGVPDEDSKPVAVRFQERAAAQENRELTLMAHLNFLAQNLHTLALPLPKEEPIAKTEVILSQPPITASRSIIKPTAGDPAGHVIHIPRPPEWDLIDSSDFSDDSEEDSDSSEYSKLSNDLETGGVKLPEDENNGENTSTTPRERGTAVSFPYIELFGIELFEISVLNIVVKCERCKDATEVTGLKDGGTKNITCKKCSVLLSVCFRKELVHSNSIRAGFLDLDGCTVVDMLPSTFIPTCSQCSTPSLGIVSVRGETTTNVCRENGCHQKFTFKIPEVKYLRITSANRLAPVIGPRRKKEVLGVTVGQELPKRGRCEHYAKSYRWFRFSCCSKVFPCDKCHDQAEEHPNEHGSRMVCGFCSREQNYRPEDCAFCHALLIGKKGHGFWEGGKGTRDKVRMSRKDPRKYKRVGGAAK